MRSGATSAIALKRRQRALRDHAAACSTDPPIPMVAGADRRSTRRGPFANARLANAGREKGVKVGNPVMSEHGLVGRIVGVTRGASRVLLLTDVASAHAGADRPHQRPRHPDRRRRPQPAARVPARRRPGAGRRPRSSPPATAACSRAACRWAWRSRASTARWRVRAVLRPRRRSTTSASCCSRTSPSWSTRRR